MFFRNVGLFRITWCCKPEDRTFHSHRWRSPKSNKNCTCLQARYSLSHKEGIDLHGRKISKFMLECVEWIALAQGVDHRRAALNAV
jgi:hypothetical protein